MISSITLLLATLALTSASPLEVRTVASLNQAAFEEAQQRDATATRAFSSTEIKTSTGQCLVVDELSGDFRANLTPIKVATCDGSTGQKWDIITKGKHNDQAGQMLVVNTLTQACMNFDPRRAAGNTVIMFSCGGRADGGGAVTNSQLFPFSGSSPISFSPSNAAGTCLAVTGSVLDQAPCKAGDASQTFTFGGGSPAAVPASSTAVGGRGSASASVSASATKKASVSAGIRSSTAPVQVPASTASSEAGETDACGEPIEATSAAPAPTATRSSTETRAITSASASKPTTLQTLTSAPASSASAIVGLPASLSTASVSRAGGVLQPSAAAEANQFDSTATRAFTSVSIKSSTGKCLFIDPLAGDFRQNLIPIKVQTCTGSANEKFDFITKGLHNNVANSTLVVSSLTNGCLNFDSRRAAGDTVIMFSCGGRAAGEGLVTDSQLFAFGGGNSIVLAPENGKGAICMFDNAGKLDSQACTGGADQVFSIVA
ncbi:hypothetical protein BGZ60DRAFT_527696 [Tricladium varicosporioides]|nr:hypothetical protein BGZ60DRAFT_527696 [Hymenoscyphus varicosporioides]